MGGGNAIEDENARDAGESDKQTSDPNGLRRNVIVEETADDGGKRTCQTPAQPMHGHIAAAQVGRCDIGNVFAGGGDESEFAKSEDDHAKPKPPEASHKRNTACAESIDQHTHTDNRQGLVPAGDTRDKVLDEDTHERVGSGDPAV